VSIGTAIPRVPQHFEDLGVTVEEVAVAIKVEDR
jgi:hypothetical protein